MIMGMSALPLIPFYLSGSSPSRITSPRIPLKYPVGPIDITHSLL